MFNVMKTNLWKIAAILGLGVAAMTSCNPTEKEPEVVDPVFPTEVTEANVEAGQSVEVSFTANLDWELSIPASEQNKYWLDDAGIPASKVTGKAGDQVVSVVFSNDEYYDANAVCEVTLAMGGQSKVIARFTRLAINRTLEVYVAETSEWGFKNTYAAEKATALALTTFEGDVTYTLPVKVVANYDWSLALPEWCAGSIAEAETLSGKAGQTVEVLLAGVLAESVMAGAEGVAKFIDATDNTKSIELPLTLPAFGERLEWVEPSTMEFEYTGSSMPAIAYVLAPKGFVVRALGWNGQWHDSAFADWVTIQTEESADPEAILQNTAVIFSIAANEGEERAADLFVFPASMANVAAGDICDFNDPNCGFLPQYAKYHVGRFTQAGVPMPFIVPQYPSSMLEAEGVFFTELGPKDSDNIMQWDIEGAESYHKVTYTGQWSYESAYFFINKPYASFKIYMDTQYPEGFFTAEVPEAEMEEYWLEVWANPDKTLGRFNMRYTPATPTHAAVVYFDENGGKVAAVLVEYNPSAGGSSEGASFTVASGYAEVMGLDVMGQPAGMLNNMISGLGVTAQEEKVIMASSPEVEFTTSFSFSQIFIIDMMGNMVDNTSAFSVYQSSNTTFKVTAANESQYLLVFMDSMGEVPVVVYYNCYF